jgi:uncharacterized protein
LAGGGKMGPGPSERASGEEAAMTVEMRFTKWGGKLHWHYPVEPLGRDRHGWWLAGPEGTFFQRGDEEPIPRPHDYVLLVPADGEWIATWNAASDTEIYVDVSTRPVLRPGLIEAVDLDLDVIRRRDGRVLLLDEDEFAEHQVLYGYPPEVVDRARATAADLLARVSARVEPFRRSGRDWLARAGAVRPG